MGEEPQFPPIPSIGDNVLGKRKRTIPREYTVLKCEHCKEEFTRSFKPGEHVFKKLDDEICPACKRRNTISVKEIYSEWYDPNKEKSKSE